MDKGMSGHVKTLLCAAFMVFLPAATCNNNSGRVTPNPPLITDQDQCALACANLQQLGCQEGNPIDMGTSCQTSSDCVGTLGAPDPTQTCSTLGKCMVSCTSFCINTEDNGVWLDPGCVKSITSCDQVESCPLPRPVQHNTCVGAACPTYR